MSPSFNFFFFAFTLAFDSACLSRFPPFAPPLLRDLKEPEILAPVPVHGADGAGVEQGFMLSQANP